MKATQAYDTATAGRALSGRGLEWVNELVSRFGDEPVAAAIEAEAPAGQFGKLLGRVRDRLAGQAARRSGGGSWATPPEVPAEVMLAIARGEAPEPPRPYIFDTRGLDDADQYDELLQWWTVHGRRTQ